jgi:hypothetical protein
MTKHVAVPVLSGANGVLFLASTTNALRIPRRVMRVLPGFGTLGGMDLGTVAAIAGIVGAIAAVLALVPLITRRGRGARPGAPTQSNARPVRDGVPTFVRCPTCSGTMVLPAGATPNREPCPTCGRTGTLVYTVEGTNADDVAKVMSALQAGAAVDRSNAGDRCPRCFASIAPGNLQCPYCLEPLGRTIYVGGEDPDEVLRVARGLEDRHAHAEKPTDTRHQS